jgi:hypothetical protein
MGPGTCLQIWQKMKGTENHLEQCLTLALWKFLTLSNHQRIDPTSSTVRKEIHTRSQHSA